MVKVLITGSNSFIGTNFRKFSHYKDVDEISLALNIPEVIEFGKYDVVLHLAAIVHQSKKIPDSVYYKVNRDLCLKVAEQAKKNGVKQFVFLSTLKVYGENFSGKNLRDESSECFPDDAYGKSKHEAEIGLKKLEDEHFVVSIIRTPLVYGDGVKANMLKIIKLIDSFPVLPFTKVNNKRNYTYTENLVGFIDRIIDTKASGIFIAMDKDSISTTELVNYLAESLGKKVKLFKLPGFFIKLCTLLAPGVFSRLFGSSEFDNSKTLASLKYQPPFSTKEGIKRMIASYKGLRNVRLEKSN